MPEIQIHDTEIIKRHKDKTKHIAGKVKHQECSMENCHCGSYGKKNTKLPYWFKRDIENFWSGSFFYKWPTTGLTWFQKYYNKTQHWAKKEAIRKIQKVKELYE